MKNMYPLCEIKKKQRFPHTQNSDIYTLKQTAAASLITEF